MIETVRPNFSAALCASAWSCVASTIEARQAGNPDPYETPLVVASLGILARDLDLPNGEVWGFVEDIINSREE